MALRLIALSVTLAICSSLSLSAIHAAEPTPEGIEFFEKKIRPVLVKHCYECHSSQSKALKGKLLLDSRAGMTKGGESGAVAVAGDAEKSLLIQALRYQSNEMPPDGKLPAETIADFETWVKMGLPDPRDNDAVKQARTIDLTEGRKFWAFQPIKQVAPQPVKNEAWVRKDIDRYVLNKLEAAELSPSAPAERATLLRRASFDLLGLPPTPAEIEMFVADTSANAVEKMVDRLLASPHYGERWGRHWLDVARFGEDQAHTFQARMYPEGYRYRDWVVNSLNNDLPYDQFLLAQIAGDLLDDTKLSKQERAAALGLFALGPVYYADNNAAKQAQADEWDDRVDTLTRGVLGLTVACARCHDHKFDPIGTSDYYALASVFASTKYVEFPLASPEDQARKQAADDKVKAEQKWIDDFRKEQAKNLRPELVKQTAAYLVGAWKLANRLKANDKYSLADSAKQDKLDEALLRRWREYLTKKASQEQPALATWHELIAKQDAKVDLSGDEAALAAVQAAAEAFQAQVIELLAANEAGDGAEQQKSKKLREQLFGDKGVLTIPENELDKFVSGDAKKQLKERRDDLAKFKKEAESIKLPMAHSLAEGSPTDLKIFVQGNPHKPGDQSQRGYPAILSNNPLTIPKSASGRLEIAKAIASGDNPLTARVAVNRVWQGHFGQGLVRTASNFGAMGERPTHPELLDYLAKKFIDSGWSLKQLHREIMCSATYQQSSMTTAVHDERDPDNRLLGHMPRRRLEVEPWRDAMLAASGTLDLKLGGPSSNLADSNFRRRTLYGFVSRHQLNELLRLFDFPDPNITSDRRTTTTVPLQQLFVLNSEFLAQQAKALAARVKRDVEASGADATEAARIRRAYLLLFSRQPTENELKLGETFLATPAPAGGLSPWEEYALALLGLNEFTFVD